MKVWPVKHSPLLRQPERFIARNELQALSQKVTHNLVNIKDESGQFLLRLGLPVRYPYGGAAPGRKTTFSFD